MDDTERGALADVLAALLAGGAEIRPVRRRISNRDLFGIPGPPAWPEVGRYRMTDALEGGPTTEEVAWQTKTEGDGVVELIVTKRAGRAPDPHFVMGSTRFVLTENGGNGLEALRAIRAVVQRGIDHLSEMERDW